MGEEDYTEVKEAVEKAGFFTTPHPSGDDGEGIVLVSRCTEGQLHGNSFRVSFKAGRWFLTTWSPAIYLVPAGANLSALCLDCLRASRLPIRVVPPDVVGRYQLVEVSEDDYGRG